MLTTNSREKSDLWNQPQSNARQHFRLSAAVDTNLGIAELIQSALSAELIAEQTIDDYYYDAKTFALFAKGYVCCLRQMLGSSALCLIPVTRNGEHDSTLPSLVAGMPDAKAPKELTISDLESDEIKTLLSSIFATKKLYRQFRVRTNRQHLQAAESPSENPVILDQVSIKTSRNSTLTKFSLRYDELIFTPNSADKDFIAVIENKLKNHVTWDLLKTNAFRSAMEMDMKKFKKAHDIKVDTVPSDRSGHDLFRKHMQTQFTQLQYWESKAIEGIDEEGVHQMRVSIRRIRAALKTFAPLLSKTEAQHWHTEFRWLGKCLGQVRDLDVFTEWLERHKLAADFDEVAHIEAYQKDIGSLYQHVRQGLLGSLDSERYRNLKRDFSTWIEQEKCFFVNNDLTWKPTQDLADALIKRAVRRTKRKITLISDQSTDEQLHEFRVECKRIRYSLDMLQEYGSKDHKPLIAKLKLIQEVLGDHQDACDRSKRIQLYANGQMSGKHGQSFVFFLGKLYAEQQSIVGNMRKAFFRQKKSVERMLEKTLKQALTPKK